MRYLFVLIIAFSASACKNNGNATSSSSKSISEVKKPVIKPIVVDASRGQAADADFSVLSWTAQNDILEVVVRYSGGCEEHDFNAYFSGMWMKSLPPKAMIELEHLNPKKDACRSLVKDTLKFDLKNLQYPGGKKVVLKWMGDPNVETTYEYGQ